MSDTPAKRKRDDADVADEQPTKVSKPALPSTPDEFPAPEVYETIVRIKAGEEEPKVFDVHKGILCFYSGYFRTAFNGRWKEAQEGAIEIPSISPDIFKHFVHWAYGRRLEAAAADYAHDSHLLPRLWVFGDAHEIPALQNEVVAMMHLELVKKGKLPNGNCINYAYENTMLQSPFRQFLLDIYAALMDFDKFKGYDTSSAWCNDALRDLLQIVWREGWRKEGRTGVQKWDLCKYHVHEQGVRCGGSVIPSAAPSIFASWPRPGQRHT